MTDFIVYQSAAKLDLARVLSRLGRPEEAAFEARAALELSEAKGDQPGIAEAQAFLEAL